MEWAVGSRKGAEPPSPPQGACGRVQMCSPRRTQSVLACQAVGWPVGPGAVHKPPLWKTSPSTAGGGGGGLAWSGLVGGVTPALASLCWAPGRPGGCRPVGASPPLPGVLAAAAATGLQAGLSCDSVDSTHHVMPPAGPSGCEVPLRLAGGRARPGWPRAGRAPRPSLCHSHCVYGAGLSSLPFSCTSRSERRRASHSLPGQGLTKGAGSSPRRRKREERKLLLEGTQASQMETHVPLRPSKDTPGASLRVQWLRF